MQTKTILRRARLADTEIIWRFRFPETEGFLRRWITGEPDNADNPIEVTDTEFADWVSSGNGMDAFGEFCLLCQQTSEHMLPYGKCVFHASAIRFDNKAWLIAAGSGVGKTTQTKTLMDLFPDQVGVINGDKPILAVQEDETVVVHSSPWTGKEGLHGAEAAALGGIFCLRRGEENAVKPLTAREAAPFLYPLIFQSFSTESVIRRAGDMAEKILNSAPSWLLTSHSIPDSTRLIYETMQQEVHHGS